MHSRACGRSRKRIGATVHQYAPATACNTIAITSTPLVKSTTTNHSTTIKRSSGCLDPRFHKQVVLQNSSRGTVANRIPNQLLDIKSSQSDYSRDTELPDCQGDEADTRPVINSDELRANNLPIEIIPVRRQRLLDKNCLEYYHKTDDTFRGSQDTSSSSTSNDKLYGSNVSEIHKKLNHTVSLSSIMNKSVFSNQTIAGTELDTKINDNDNDDGNNCDYDRVSSTSSTMSSFEMMHQQKLYMSDRRMNLNASPGPPRIVRDVVLIIGILHLMFVIGQPITELLLAKQQFPHHANHASSRFLETIYDNYLVASFRAAFSQVCQFVDHFLQSLQACTKCN